MSAINRIQKIIDESYRKGLLVTRSLTGDRDVLELTSYYSNRNLRFRYLLQSGRLHGFGRSWYENGQLEREDPFHKAVLHGAQRSWYQDGTLRSEMRYINNYLDGPRREWYPSGRLMKACGYQMNLLEGICTDWHPNGQISEQTPYWHGQIHGICKRYDARGKLLIKEIYVRGMHYSGRIRRLVNARRIDVRVLGRIESAAIRHFLLEEIGYARLLQEASAEQIDQEGECILFRCAWHRDEEPVFLVKVKCPSTGVFYTLRVSPQVRTVREAIAWTFSMAASQYDPQEES